MSSCCERVEVLVEEVEVEVEVSCIGPETRLTRLEEVVDLVDDGIFVRF